MYQAFAIQPLAATVLFVDGGAVDEVFGYKGTAAKQYTTARYNSSAGAFQANYFLTDLKSRGLIDDEAGPKLKHFPFYEDASVIYGAIRDFMTTFVASYYPSDAAVAADAEVQGWASEANGAAEAIDFPTSIPSRDALVGVLAHMAHLASTAHHVVNTNELLSASSTLPFHPPALYSPVPTAKHTRSGSGTGTGTGTGVNASSSSSSLAGYMPPFAKVATQLGFAGLFARPLLEGTDRSLVHMFDGEEMLGLLRPEVRGAAERFRAAMEAFGGEVAGRAFDERGLSQGMPFLWQALDPRAVPYSITT